MKRKMLTRRDFLRVAGLAATGTVLAGCSPAETPPATSEPSVTPEPTMTPVPTTTPVTESWEDTVALSAGREPGTGQSHDPKKLLADFRAKFSVNQPALLNLQVDSVGRLEATLVAGELDEDGNVVTPVDEKPLLIRDIFALDEEGEPLVYKAEETRFFYSDRYTWMPAKPQTENGVVAHDICKGTENDDATVVSYEKQVDSETGEASYVITHQTVNGVWQELSQPLELEENETIFAEERDIGKEIVDGLYETLTIEAIRIIGRDTSSLETGRKTLEEIVNSLNPQEEKIVEGFLEDENLTSAMEELRREAEKAMDTAIVAEERGENGEIILVDSEEVEIYREGENGIEVGVEWKNKALEGLLQVVDSKLRTLITELAVLPEGQEEIPVVTTLNLGGKDIEIVFSWNKPLDIANQYRQPTIDTTKEVMADSDVQAEVARRYVEFLKLGQDGKVREGYENMTAEDFAVYESSCVIDNGTLQPIEEHKDKAEKVVPDRIEFYFIHEDEDSTRLIKSVQQPSSPLNIGMFSYDENRDLETNGFGYPNYIWFTQEIDGKQVMTLIRVQPGNKKAWPKMDPTEMITGSAMALEYIAVAVRGEPFRQSISGSANSLRPRFKEMVFDYLNKVMHNNYYARFDL